MTPALDDLLRDWTDYMAANARAKAAYNAKFRRGERCRYCSGLFIDRPQHEAICKHKPDN